MDDYRLKDLLIAVFAIAALIVIGAVQVSACPKASDSMTTIQHKAKQAGFVLQRLQGLQVDRALGHYNDPSVPSTDVAGTVRLKRGDINAAYVALPSHENEAPEIIFMDRHQCTLGDALIIANPGILFEIMGKGA